MTGLKYMLQIEKLDALIKSKENEVQNLMDVATSITAVMKDVNVQSLGSGDKIGNCAIKIADLQDELEKDIESYIETKKDVFEKISKLDAKEYLILYKRYFEMKRYEVIAEEMFFDVRHIFRIHKSALKNLEKII